MITAFVIGNGISRRGVDLNLLKPLGKIYGCNALYRDFTPDVLISTDTLIATSIQQSGYAKTNCFYTRKPIDGLNARQIPKDYYSYSSGSAAVGIAVEDRNNLIYMLGFDIGPAENNSYNNFYADTEFYKQSSESPVYTGNWIKQIVTIVQKFKGAQFVRVTGPTTAKISEFDVLPNIQSMSLASFLERINTRRNL